MNMLDIHLPEIKHPNAIIQALGRRVYAFLGEEFYLKVSEAPKEHHAWVRLNITYLGQSHDVYVSQSMVNAYLAKVSLNLETMSQDATALWLLSILKDLPPNLQIKELQLVEQIPAEMTYLNLVSYKKNVPYEWYLGIAETLPITLLVEALASICKGAMPPIYSKLPIEIPLIACVLDIPAHEVSSLVVGDVLLLGGV